ncbi:MAG: DUF1501 domain-containing protein [Planctomycetota bacterium]|nr:MAG: DUF1501 domain-containing protein [Planctomycetota bacterium]
MNRKPSHSLESHLNRRRHLLQLGQSGLLGLGLGSFMNSTSARAGVGNNEIRSRAKSLIIVFCTGAISHHDTFDMKPDAPLEIRGEFNPIQTPIPGTVICEHLPKLASRAHKYALVRSLSHKDNNHLMSTHHVLTGHLQPGAFFDKVASRDDWPCYSAGCEYLRPRTDGIPSGVNLPTFLMSSPLTWPGQHAGILGPMYDPWQIVGDPSSAEFRVDALTLAQEIDAVRLEQRRSLLSRLDQTAAVSRDAAASRMNEDQKLAFSMLSSGKLSQAFEMHREPSSVRDAYGRHPFGQSLLLARRLVEAGVPIVQANMGPVQNWDSHQAIFSTLKGRLLSPLDQAVAALLDDLESSGRLADTMVILLGEFGRTPKINKEGGRDHWGPCFTGLFAGAGVQGGKVIGRTDDIAAYPDSAAYSPDDIGATIYTALGLEPHSIVHDRIGRPVHLNEGKVIEALYNGAEST